MAEQRYNDLTYVYVAKDDITEEMLSESLTPNPIPNLAGDEYKFAFKDRYPTCCKNIKKYTHQEFLEDLEANIDDWEVRE